MINRFIEKLKDPQERKLFMAIQPVWNSVLFVGVCLDVWTWQRFYRLG